MSRRQDIPPPTAKVASGASDAAPGLPARPGIATHYLRYSVANMLLLVAGVISFPVLTRLLDNTQYGVMGYFNTWVLIAVAVAKLGGQHAIIRFYPHDGDARQQAHFSTNFVTLPMLLSLSLWTVVAAALAGWQWTGRAEFSGVFWCVVLIIPVMVVVSIVQAVVRASERSGLLMTTKVTGRGMELALVLGLVILVERSALSVFGGRLIAATLLLGYFVYWASRNLSFSRRTIDLAATGGALMYGLPLMANEFAAMSLVAIDRVLLKEITDDYATVGIYTIGYTLAMQVNLFMSATLSEAFVPVVNRIYGGEGDVGVRELKGRVLLPMTYASLGVAAMIVAVGKDVLVALAGADKAASGAVFVAVGTVMALYPLLDISGYGLLLRKRSMRVFSLTAGAAVFNIAANFVLIPIYGYMGAAWATVISYVALSIATCLCCPRELLRFPDARALGTAGGFALLLLVIVIYTDMFGLSGPWSRVFAGGALFLAVYALPVWLLDPRLRATLPRWNWRKTPTR
ncbi:oligosaccharide flippase family protein [Lysobacter sp. D1-1-M9]|uniref:oligosaccharide flippase family protein n=1 Tax=Novilysobacter longmucuonensis TaxID=3098603 RepID=UPI002FC8EA55